MKLGTSPCWPICQLFVDVESLVNSQGEILNDIGILGGCDCWFVGLFWSSGNYCTKILTGAICLKCRVLTVPFKTTFDSSNSDG